MKKVLTLILLLNVVSLTAQNMLPNEILQSVFLIKVGTNTGSCFYVSVDSVDYLVTAKHLFPSTLPHNSSVEIEILRNDGWLKFKTTLLTHVNSQIDIALLNMNSSNIKANLFDLESKNYFVSQECFFVGFPFGLNMEDKGGKMNDGFPIPFVKKGIVSAFMSDSSGMTQIFLDGHNNPGFSGGPVVVSNFDSESKHKMKIIGVVSAYLTENKTIKTPLGDFINNENSGIVLSYAIDHIYEIINRK